MKTLFLIGRILFGGYFLYSGIHHFSQLSMLSQYAESKNVPAPKLAVTGSGLLVFLGGLSILLGTCPHIGALLIDRRILGGCVAGDAQLLDDYRAQPAHSRNDQFQQEYGAVGCGPDVDDDLPAVGPQPRPLAFEIPACIEHQGYRFAELSRCPWSALECDPRLAHAPALRPPAPLTREGVDSAQSRMRQTANKRSADPCPSVRGL
jgi:hypothetical protein